eukprot:TRINITY_DN2571_c0_g1_i1.p1 TRINITY_DN2571_c0_g1~~TRINITY_DN2571_c0_g1_i1.p1  ORF type:complete len:654 (+),score=119.58 TRINITY_DN2571_c0_g1_i1:53-2014(+)
MADHKTIRISNLKKKSSFSNSVGNRSARANTLTKGLSASGRSLTVNGASPRPRTVSLSSHSFQKTATTTRMGEVDRSDWVVRVAENNPAVQNLRERLSVVNRGIAFSKLYNKGRLKGVMAPDDVVKLILQYLENEGLHDAKMKLEIESGIVLDKHTADTRLTTLLKIVLDRTEQIYDLSMDDKGYQKTDERIEFALNSLGLLREDVESLANNSGVNLWDENINDGRIYVTSEGEELTGEPREGCEIRALSLNQLIILLTPITAGNNQNEFTGIVLLTQNSFSTQELFLSKLIERYHVPPVDDMSPEEQSQRKTTIQLRVLNIIKRWIDSYFYDLSDKVCQLLHDFIKGDVCLTLEFHGSKILENLNAKMASRNKGEDLQEIDMTFSSSPPQPIIPKNIFLPSLSWLDIDPVELARQLTLIDFGYFRAVKPTEFLDQAWSKARLKHRAVNLLACINRFNIISDWAAAKIVSTERLKDRTKVWSRLITFATELLNLNNYNAVMAILSAFNTASIGRLQFSIDGLSQSDRDAWNHLSATLDSASGFVNYRRVIEHVAPPAVPYLGLFTQDLTFIDDGNDDTYKGLINWKKRELTGNTIYKIQNLQQSAYNLQSIYQIQHVLYVETEQLDERWRDEKELYRASLEIEPRKAKKSQLK